VNVSSAITFNLLEQGFEEGRAAPDYPLRLSLAPEFGTHDVGL